MLRNARSFRRSWTDLADFLPLVPKQTVSMNEGTSVWNRFQSSAPEEAGEQPSTSGRSEAVRTMFPHTVVEETQHPIRQADVSHQAWVVLSKLRNAGHVAFLVGGTVRDLILGRTPKDIDIITSAELNQVKKLFDRCVIIGRRFPICTINSGQKDVEVSSFSTGVPTHIVLPPDMNQLLTPAKNHARANLEKIYGKAVTWAEARQMNARKRDFTVNSLFYDPCSQVIFDYTGGMDDLKRRRLATIGNPIASFEEDPARILRAIRFAGRVGLTIDEKTVEAMVELGGTVLKIPEQRAQLEVHSILGYGYAKVSMELMWKHRVLNHIFPSLVEFLKKSGHSQDEPLRNCLLLDLLGALDNQVQLSKPADEAVVAALLAAPLIGSSFQTLRIKLKNGKQNKSSKDSAISRVMAQPENVVYSTLTRGVLESLARPYRGYNLVTKVNLQKASKLLYFVKGYRDAEVLKGFQPEKKMIMSILGAKSVAWDKKTDLRDVLG
ncbi:hypothetical protein BSKO_01231 [Bryopsis sp. KO-2023]|nr:hypothetical protein BSKO_01231 [Bryopsis sp. KO-2023]